jgi:hypothetical protein
MNCQTPSACQTRELALDLTSGGTGSGHDSAGFELTNQGSRTCTLYGFPSAVALNSKKRIVREFRFHHSQPTVGEPENREPREIALRPGEHAWFEIDSTNPTGREDDAKSMALWKKAAWVRITPPMNKKPFRQLFEFSSCDADASISFLVPGSPND